jgi:hypothetical protein
MSGGNFYDDVKPVTDFLRPLAEAGREKGIDKINASGLRVKISKAQHRTLKKGGKITIKPEMLHEMGEFVPMAEALMKKAMTAMKKGKGIRVGQSPTGIPTNAESLLGEASPQPQMGGKGYRFGDFLNDIRPVTDFLRPLAEAGRDKAIDKVKGYGIGHPDYALFKKMRGKGYHFRDFLNDIRPVTDFLRPLAEAGRDKGVEKIKGYGMDGGSFMTAGALSTAITAQNSGMIQQGSPYAHPNSQAMRPFVPSHSQLSGTNIISTHKSSRIYRK